MCSVRSAGTALFVRFYLVRRVDVEFVRGERREQGEVLVERESWLLSSEIGGGVVVVVVGDRRRRSWLSSSWL